MRFELFKPENLQTALAMLSEYRRRAKILAGGTDLVVQMRQNTVSPEFVISIDSIKGLDFIEFDPANGLKIGALTTVSGIEKSTVIRQKYSVIKQAAAVLASRGVRNLATVAGNLCHASPAADMAPPLIALGATLRIASLAGAKTVSLDRFFIGPGMTALGDDEMVTEISVPPQHAVFGAAYLKHGVRSASDLSVVSIAATLAFDGDIVKDARLVLGAVAPTPLRSLEAEAALQGRKISKEIGAEAAEAAAAACRPISDIRASAEYRREMVKVFTRQAIAEAHRRAEAVEEEQS